MRTEPPYTLDDIHEASLDERHRMKQEQVEWIKAQRKKDKRKASNERCRVWNFLHPEKVKEYSRKGQNLIGCRNIFSGYVLFVEGISIGNVVKETFDGEVYVDFVIGGC